MSFSQLDRITLAAKALAGGVIDADPSAQWYESTLPFSFALPADKVWTQSDLVKANPAANAAAAQANAAGPLLGVIDDLSANASSIRLTPVPGVNNTFVALSTYGDFSSPLLDNWLAPVFVPRTNGLPSTGYAVRLYDGNPALGGTEVLTTDGTTGTGVNKSVAWMFNYAGGLLLTSSDFNVADPHITGFRYTGTSAAAPSTGSSRRSYGTCSLTKVGTSFPASIVAVRREAERGGGHVQLLSEFNANYSKSMVHLQVYPDPTGPLLTEITQVFPSVASIVTWVNANVPNNGVGAFTHVCTMEVYDIVDPNIVPPSKVYGKNRVWASLVASAPGGYYHRPKTASSFHAINSINSLQLATLLNGIWTNLYGLTMPAPALWTAQEFGCFWVGRNRHRKYAMPSLVTTALALNPGLDRYERDIVLGSTGVPALGPRFHDALAGLPVCYASLDPAGNFFGAFDPIFAFSEVALRIMAGHSIVVGYPVKPPFGDFRSVYIKPVGVDHFFFDSFDNTKYQLEAVGVQGRETHPRISPLVISSNVPAQRSSGPLDGRDIGSLMGYTPERSRAFPGRHGYRLGSVKFQYRDLTTGRVSPVSTAAINSIWRRRFIPFGLMVRNHVNH